MKLHPPQLFTTWLGLNKCMGLISETSSHLLPPTWLQILKKSLPGTQTGTVGPRNCIERRATRPWTNNSTIFQPGRKRRSNGTPFSPKWSSNFPTCPASTYSSSLSSCPATVSRTRPTPRRTRVCTATVNYSAGYHPHRRHPRSLVPRRRKTRERSAYSSHRVRHPANIKT